MIKIKKEIKFLNWVQKFYQWQLHHCDEALEYVLPRVTDRLILREFGIGLAGSYNELSKTIQDKYPRYMLMAKDLGLVRQRDDGSYYDFFRERIMFPIHDEHGSIVGFSGRAFVEGYKVKYVNSSSSSLFDKSELIFNLHRALPSIKDKGYVYLVEGFFDAIRLHAHMYSNVIAAMGTAFRETHADVLKSYTDKVVIAYDGDDAGQDSTVDLIHMLKRKGFKVKVVQFPDALDPDAYAEKYGHLSPLDNPVNSYQYLFDIECEILRGKSKLSQVSEALRSLPVVLKGSSRATYEPLFARTAHEIGMDFNLYKQDLEKLYGFKFSDEKPITREIDRKRGDIPYKVALFQDEELILETRSTMHAHFYKMVREDLKYGHADALAVADMAYEMYRKDTHAISEAVLLEYVAMYYDTLKPLESTEARLESFYDYYIQN